MLTLAVDAGHIEFADLLDKIEHGETVILTRNGKTIAEVSPSNQQPPTPSAHTRQVGKWTLGLMQNVTIPASFDDPLDDELLDLFEGKSP